jgi:hypothetical protein
MRAVVVIGALLGSFFSAAGPLEQDDFSSNRHPAPGYCWSMIFSDLASPAEAGFAKAGNRYPPRIASGAGFFGIML